MEQRQNRLDKEEAIGKWRVRKNLPRSIELEEETFEQPHERVRSSRAFHEVQGLDILKKSYESLSSYIPVCDAFAIVHFDLFAGNGNGMKERWVSEHTFSITIPIRATSSTSFQRFVLR